MITSISRDDLFNYVGAQLSTFFPDKYGFYGNDINRAFDIALDRLQFCFKHISEKSYCVDGVVTFNHLHSDHYCHFLWFLANSLWAQSQNKPICDKLVFLNKTLNAVLITYKVNLPNIFLLGHPVGTVLGDAFYSDFLVVLQNVTVNHANGQDGSKIIKFGKGVCLASGSKVIGEGSIGNNCSIGSNALLYNPNLPDNHIAFINQDGLQIKASNKQCLAQRYFFTDLKSY
nr:hypothetical protein [uncultured Aminipila sp.]